MRNGEERRNFKRFPLDFGVEILSKDHHGRIQKETALLKDVSGEGVCFISERPQRYVLGQLLDLSIILPGTKKIAASMKASGTVVRMDVSRQGERLGCSRKAKIAVRLESPLNFERVDLP
jgi:hypothetical protein